MNPFPCMDCDSFYIGQTSKELSVRVNHHQYCVKAPIHATIIVYNHGNRK